MFDHLVQRWRDLFNVDFDVLLYDLTSTYFESDPPFGEEDKRQFGYSRDKRSDCVQVVIALVVTPEGLPLAYEVLPGNTADKSTLRGFLDRIEAQYGKVRRVWVMDRGIPTEETLERMRRSESTGALPGGDTQGALVPSGKGSPAQALAAGSAGCAGETVAPGRGAVCLRPERRSRGQGTGDAPAPTQAAVGAFEAASDHDPHPSRTVDEARRRSQPVSGCLAFGGGASR